MRKITSILIIFSFCLALQSCREDIAEIPGQLTDNQYKVYSDALLQLKLLSEGKDMLVIREMTTVGRQEFDERHRSYLKKNFGEKINDHLINQFGAVNAKPVTLQDKFSDSLNIVLISKAEEDKIFDPIDESWKRWKRFYLKYPKSTGIVELSSLAFDVSKTKALLYYGIMGNYRAGAGYYVLLKRVNDKWVVEKKVKCWIS